MAAAARKLGDEPDSGCAAERAALAGDPRRPLRAPRRPLHRAAQAVLRGARGVSARSARLSAAAMNFGTKHWPTEIRVKKAEKRLEIDFDDGKRFSYPAEFLRVESPSAEVQGHHPAEKQVVHGRMHVGILEVEPIGNYAV